MSGGEGVVKRLRRAGWMPSQSLLAEAADALEALQAELQEQARIIGMSGEREAAHLARIAQLEAELAGAKGLLSECPRLLECVERYSLDAIVESLIDRINAYLAEPRT